MSKTTLSKTIEGLGNPTVQELRDLLEGLPLDARLTVENIEGDRPFDPRGWRIKATYEAPESKKPFHSHPAGYRSGGAKPRGLKLEFVGDEMPPADERPLTETDPIDSDDFDVAGRPIDDPGNELTRTRPRVVKDSPQA